MADSIPETRTEPERGPFQQLAGFYASPRETFASVLKRPGFLPPLLALIVLNLVFTAFWMQKVDLVEFSKAQIEESGRADEIIPERVEQLAKFFRVAFWVGALLGAPIVLLIVGSVYLFVFRFMFGSELSFSQSLTIAAWSFLVVALVTTPLTLVTITIKGDWNVNPQEALQANASLLLEKESTPKPLWSLAGSLDLFSFWSLYLLSVGFGVASRRPSASAVAGVVGPWALYVLGKVGAAAVF